MEPEDAVLVLDEIIGSLRENPGQFNISVVVNTAGAVGIGGPGGPGIVGIAHGGGTGVHASASAPSQVAIDIARGQVESRLDEEFGSLLQTLDEIKAEIQRPDASADRAKGLLKRIGDWVPNVVAAVVAHLVARSIPGA